MLATMLWDVFGPTGKGFAITMVVILNFGTWVYCEITIAGGGETRSLITLKKYSIVSIVVASAMVIVGGVFSMISGH